MGFAECVSRGGAGLHPGCGVSLLTQAFFQKLAESALVFDNEDFHGVGWFRFCDYLSADFRAREGKLPEVFFRPLSLQIYYWDLK